MQPLDRGERDTVWVHRVDQLVADTQAEGSVEGSREPPDISIPPLITSWNASLHPPSFQRQEQPGEPGPPPRWGTTYSLAGNREPTALACLRAGIGSL